jgi:hypothetical protein
VTKRRQIRSGLPPHRDPRGNKAWTGEICPVISLESHLAREDVFKLIFYTIVSEVIDYQHVAVLKMA